MALPPTPAPPGLSAPPKAKCRRWPPGSAHEKTGKLDVPAGAEDAASSLSLPVSVSSPWVPRATPLSPPSDHCDLAGEGSGSAHGPKSLLSPFRCLTHAALAPFLVTSGLCPHPRSQNSPHPCPHSLGEGEGLAGWVSGHQAITTEPATVPGQPGTPLLALPGGPGVHPGEAWDWPMATAQLKGTIQSEYGGLPRD